MKVQNDHDNFLGEWAVKEWVYSPQADLLGSIHQQRCLYRGSIEGEIRVDQFCTPSLALGKTPMGSFAGTFSFRLQKNGFKRLYLGPDVQGFGFSLGEIFLCGEGIWPRFGYNFRSWSVKLSDSLQLTGGVFYRGFNAIGVIFGVATLGKSLVQDADVDLKSQIRSGQGQATSLCLSTEQESMLPISRQFLNAGSWIEAGPDREEIFKLTACDSGYLIELSNLKDERLAEVGMAVEYGPCLFWESHGQSAHSTLGLEINDPFSSQMFSIRRKFRGGRLQSLNVQQLNT